GLFKLLIKTKKIESSGVEHLRIQRRTLRSVPAKLFHANFRRLNPSFEYALLESDGTRVKLDQSVTGMDVLSFPHVRSHDLSPDFGVNVDNLTFRTDHSACFH